MEGAEEVGGGVGGVRMGVGERMAYQLTRFCFWKELGCIAPF